MFVLSNDNLMLKRVRFEKTKILLPALIYPRRNMRKIYQYVSVCPSVSYPGEECKTRWTPIRDVSVIHKERKKIVLL